MYANYYTYYFINNTRTHYPWWVEAKRNNNAELKVWENVSSLEDAKLYFI